MDYYQYTDSPLGKILMKSNGEALTGLWFADKKEIGKVKESPLPVFEETKEWLRAYFEGFDPGFTPHIKFYDTLFREKVWSGLLKIPYGQTVSYSQLAEMIGVGRLSARAVGSAVGKNPIAIIVPCHRVIREDGKIGEYAGGVERKEKLLTLEGAKYKR